MFKRRRSRSSDGQAGDLGDFERTVLRFMGPPEIGDYAEREGYVADEAALLCPRCGRAWDEHERVHTGTMTYRRCPVPRA